MSNREEAIADYVNRWLSDPCWDIMTPLDGDPIDYLDQGEEAALMEFEPYVEHEALERAHASAILALIDVIDQRRASLMDEMDIHRKRADIHREQGKAWLMATLGVTL